MKKNRSGLPAPLNIYSGLGARFEIYRAKDLHNPKWNSIALKKLVLEARRSYARYGNRPLLDAYDAKAAIYLVRVKYALQSPARTIEEWLSIRMVPGDGEPLGVGEPEIYQRKGKSIDHWISKKNAINNIWKTMASSSRMCGIQSEQLPHRYTGICFALIHKQFLIDYPLKKFPYRHITAIIRPDFYKKGLGQTIDGKRLYPTFVPAYKFLAVDRKEVQVKRDIYSYEYPTYWLNKRKLLRLVNDIRKNDHRMPVRTIAPDVISKLASHNERLVTIADVLISSKKMRNLVDKFVPDVPELKITEASIWYKSMDKMISAGKLKIIASHK